MKTKTDEQKLKETIASLCAKHDDRKARWNSMKSIKWVLYCAQLNLFAGMSGINIVPVESIEDAVRFDGRDNEDMKRAFYKAITGIDWQIKIYA